MTVTKQKNTVTNEIEKNFWKEEKKGKEMQYSGKRKRCRSRITVEIVYPVGNPISWKEIVYPGKGRRKAI